MKFKKEVRFTAGSRTALEQLQISRRFVTTFVSSSFRVVTIRSGRDDPSFEKSTRLLEVSGQSCGERKKNFDEQRRLCCSKMLYASFSKSRD